MIYQDEYDTLTEVQEPLQYIDDYEAPSGQPIPVDTDEELCYIKQSHLRDATGKKLKNVNGYLQCGKLHKNKFYSSGKYVDFDVFCHNTRKCERCRDKMIDELIEEMTVNGATVPLYCHLISSDPKKWNNWRQWYVHHHGDSDFYKRFPLPNGQSMIISTVQENSYAPLLTDMKAQVRKWVEERGDVGKISGSAPMRQCSNPSCQILYSSRKKQCPECKTVYVAPKKSVTSPAKDSVIASLDMNDADIQRLFKRALEANGVSIKRGRWEIDDSVLDGRDKGKFLTEIAEKVSRS